MSVQTAALSKLYIGTTLSVNFDQVDATVAAAVEADDLVPVGEIEDHGEFGDEAGEATFTAVGDRRTRKFKTTFNAGTIELVLGFDPDDTGQQDLVDAMASDLDFNFKVTLNDAPAGSSATPTTFYFRAKVMSNRIRHGNVENVVRRVVRLGINTRIIEVAASV